MAGKQPKRPRDMNQWAKLVVDIATGSAEDQAETPDTPERVFARAGGLKGGKARAAKLTPERRRAIARRAAKARWK